MIERHISFTVPTDKAADFERFFVDAYRPPVLDMPGLIECTMLREMDNPEAYQMVFRWETPENAAAWRTSEVHQGLQPTLASLNTGMVITPYRKIA